MFRAGGREDMIAAEQVSGGSIGKKIMIVR